MRLELFKIKTFGNSYIKYIVYFIDSLLKNMFLKTVLHIACITLPKIKMKTELQSNKGFLVMHAFSVVHIKKLTLSL